MKKKEKIVYKKYHYLIILFLTALSAAMMYPMVWTILTSFKSNAEIRINRTKFFPEEWTVEGYISAFEKAPIGQWLLNSLFITFCVTAAVILTSTLMGYVFAKYEFKAKKPLFILLLATMMVPPQVTMIPRYLMIQKLGLFNTVWALIVPGLVTGFSVYLARQFISDVPDSICEAAKIDGASGFNLFRHITIPLVSPVTFYLLITGLIGGFQVFVEVLVMVPNGGLNYSAATVVFYLYDKAFGNNQMGYGSAMAFILAIFIFIVTAINFRVQDKWVKTIE